MDLALDEFALIEKLFAPLAQDVPGALGLADDAVTLAVPPGQELVLTADALVAGVHFFPADPPALIARKLLRVNLSDLAAKGARPLGYLMTLALTRGIAESWLHAFAQGLAADQAAYGIHLMGGDTVVTPGPLTLSLTALGLVEHGRAVRRAGALPGDLVYVTGSIGDGALGLEALKGGLDALDAGARETLIARYHLPQPRVAFAPRLIGRAHAALDVSDGLIADLGHLARASGVAARLDLEKIPLSPPAQSWAGGQNERRLALAAGGDDYEILLAAPPEAGAALQKEGAALGVPVTAIGRIEAGSGVRVVDAGGGALPVTRGGFKHFLGARGEISAG